MEVGSRQESFKARTERSRWDSTIRPESGEAKLMPISLYLERRTVTVLVTCMVQRSELIILRIQVTNIHNTNTVGRVMDQELTRPCQSRHVAFPLK